MGIKHGLPLMGRMWADGIKYGGRYLGPNGRKKEENEKNFIVKSFLICTSQKILCG
jgi:hypothetical protein